MENIIPFDRSRVLIKDDFFFLMDNIKKSASDLASWPDPFRLELRETEENYIIEAELPGVRRDEIELCIEGEYLSICVLREQQMFFEKLYYIHKERNVTSMSRRVRLAKAKKDNIYATLENGFLHITIPKDDSPIPRYNITIR